MLNACASAAVREIGSDEQTANIVAWGSISPVPDIRRLRDGYGDTGSST